jgi:hypothetical protein
MSRNLIVTAAAALFALFSHQASAQVYHLRPLPGPHGGVCPAFAMTEDGTVLAAGPAAIYGIGAREKMYRRPYTGSEWQRWVGIPDTLELYALQVVAPQTVLAGTSDGLWVSQQDPPGRDWTPTAFFGERVTALAFLRDSAVYCGLASGEIYRTTNRGGDWSLVSQREDFLPRAFTMDEAQRLYVRSLFSRQWRIDGGAWTPIPDAQQAIGLDMLPLGGGVFVAAGNGGLLRSSDSGLHWDLRMETNQSPTYASFALAEGGSVYAGMTRLVEDSIVGGVYKSVDGGLSWTQLHRGPITGIRFGPRGVLLAASFAAGILRVDTADGTTTYLGGSSAHVRRLAWNPNPALPFEGHMLFATLDTLRHVPGIVRSTDMGRSWEWIPLSYRVQTHVVTDRQSSVAAWNHDAQRLHLSRDNGESWMKREMPVRSVAVYLAPDSSILVGAFTPTGQLHRSTDDGATWTAITLDPGQIVYALAGTGASVFAVTPTGVFRSLDTGETWARVHTFAVSGVVPTGVSALVRGGAWPYTEVAVSYDAPSGARLLRSGDNGDSWSAAQEVAGSGAVIFDVLLQYSATAVITADAFDHTNGPRGNSNVLTSHGQPGWSMVFFDGGDRDATCQATADFDWFVGTRGYGVYTWQSWTGVDEAVRPTDAALHANYPNPFNPSTVIPFTLERPMVVTVVVTDLLGREVARPLHTAMHEAGRHELRFDAADLPTGTYVVRLITANGVHTRKVMLVE